MLHRTWNEDVLHLIALHLTGQDAMNLATTSRMAYQAAILRVAASAKCDSPAQLQRFHAYILGRTEDGRTRARYLEDLIISENSFLRRRFIQRDIGAELNDVVDTQVIQIMDILQAASNLRRLVIAHLYRCMCTDPRMASSLPSLHALHALELVCVGDEEIKTISLPPNIVTLTLSQRSSINSAPSFLRLLVALPRLKTLMRVGIR
ncbi:uncharacterized protein BXZ73DRAFT_45859 [Epithele typhae]|uniref:uncharacterized protein n=1 Tax=Epithele typhae TaxID=378194 RepID=UPI0020078571|nr:uncharacterized protein BXZ73DRAFT_45859 [Epithele typhae]KAH9934507.1 hypothetical protein BXZ73DRAFT_45859 [Epithele typhae]